MKGDIFFMKLRSIAIGITWFGFSVSVGVSVCSASSPWYSPPKGSAERAQIMDALRAKLATYDATNKLCLSPSTGWLSVEPQTRDGRDRREIVNARLKRGKSGWDVDALACAEEDCAKGTDAKAMRSRVKPLCD
jgi:hypothetical protein